MFKNNKLVLTFAMILALVSFEVKAADQDIGAEVDFVASLALNNAVDIDYGLIEYTGANANNIDIDSSDASITCSDTTNYTCPSSGTRGSVEISATTGYTVDISCETTGIINNGTDALNLSTTEFTVNGSTTSCAGLGTSPGSHVMTGTTSTDTVYVGARIVVTAAGVQSTGTYDTATGTGDPITVRVVYQ